MDSLKHRMHLTMEYKIVLILTSVAPITFAMKMLIVITIRVDIVAGVVMDM